MMWGGKLCDGCMLYKDLFLFMKGMKNQNAGPNESPYMEGSWCPEDGEQAPMWGHLETVEEATLGLATLITHCGVSSSQTV